jgi:hypothetical protein
LESMKIHQRIFQFLVHITQLYPIGAARDAANAHLIDSAGEIVRGLFITVAADKGVVPEADIFDGRVFIVRA